MPTTRGKILGVPMVGGGEVDGTEEGAAKSSQQSQCFLIS